MNKKNKRILIRELSIFSIFVISIAIYFVINNFNFEKRLNYYNQLYELYSDTIIRYQDSINLFKQNEQFQNSEAVKEPDFKGFLMEISTKIGEPISEEQIKAIKIIYIDNYYQLLEDLSKELSGLLNIEEQESILSKYGLIQPEENAKIYYNYLKSKGIDVAPTYESFVNTLEDYSNRLNYYEYLKTKEVYIAPSFESFSTILNQSLVQHKVQKNQIFSIDDLIKDFYAKYDPKGYSKEQVEKVKEKYGFDYELLIKDFYTKYDSSRLSSEQVKKVLGFYGLKSKKETEYLTYISDYKEIRRKIHQPVKEHKPYIITLIMVLLILIYPIRYLYNITVWVAKNRKGWFRLALVLSPLGLILAIPNGIIHEMNLRLAIAFAPFFIIVLIGYTVSFVIPWINQNVVGWIKEGFKEN